MFHTEGKNMVVTIRTEVSHMEKLQYISPIVLYMTCHAPVTYRKTYRLYGVQWQGSSGKNGTSLIMHAFEWAWHRKSCDTVLRYVYMSDATAT